MKADVRWRGRRVEGMPDLRWLFVIGAALAALQSLQARGAEPGADVSAMDFPAGGLVRMKLHAGAMEVVGTPQDRIAVTWTSESPVKPGDVKVRMLITDATEAFVEVDGPESRVRYRVEVPARSNVVIRMTAGDLDVRAIRGDIDAELGAGNMELRLAEVRAYGDVRASVTVGGLDAVPWNFSRGGLLRSFDQTGTGDHRLRASVTAGQLTIRGE
jgi:hypothetical protein